MARNKAVLLGLLMFFTAGHVSASSASINATVVPLVNGGQANITISNSDPNLFTVAGDRITAITSSNSELTQQEQTANGGLIVSTLMKEPFTVILETERGLTFSVQAVPRTGVGRTIQLVSDLVGTGSEARTWEESNSYESTLVSISQFLLSGMQPPGWQSIPVTSEKLAMPNGLVARPHAVWVGNHLKAVRYRVSNLSNTAIDITESDLWEKSVRAVLFTEPTRQLIPGGSFNVFIISTGGSADGQH